MVYTRKEVADLRTSDPGVLGAIARAEAERPLEQTVESVFQAYLGNFNHRADLLQSSSALDTARSFLSEHSRLWALLRTAKFVVKTENHPACFGGRDMEGSSADGTTQPGRVDTIRKRGRPNSPGARVSSGCAEYERSPHS
jgi:hypothetical protein